MSNGTGEADYGGLHEGWLPSALFGSAAGPVYWSSRSRSACHLQWLEEVTWPRTTKSYRLGRIVWVNQRLPWSNALPHFLRPRRETADGGRHANAEDQMNDGTPAELQRQTGGRNELNVSPTVSFSSNGKRTFVVPQFGLQLCNPDSDFRQQRPEERQIS